MVDLIDRQALIERIVDTLCKGCNDADVGNCMGCVLNDALFITYATANVEPKKGEWISMEDALPTDDTLYLVKLDSRGEKLRHAAVDTDRISIHGGWVRWQGYVTHWMPFPIWLL